MSMYLMEFSGLQWPREYTQDIFDILKQKETELRPKFLQSPQLCARNEVISWMKNVCISMKLNILVLHLSADLLDTFMDNYDIKNFRFRLVGTCCIMIAAKFEQGGCASMPTYSKIHSIGCAPDEIIDFEALPNIETKVLDEYRWRLSLPTVATFVSFFLPLAIQPYDIPPSTQRTETKERELQMEMRDHLQDSLDKILFDQKAILLPRSMLAAACVVVARMQLHLEPIWPENLIILTRYHINQLTPALQLVLGYYGNVDLECSPLNDSGYVSQ